MVWRERTRQNNDLELARLAGCFPAGVLCEIVNRDGTMSRRDQLLSFAKSHGLLTITISDLIRYRRYYESLVERIAVTRMPTRYGVFQAYSYRSKIDDIEHIAMVYGDVQNHPEDVLVPCPRLRMHRRLHSRL